DQIAGANITAFIAHVRRLGAATEDVTDYDSLYRWSVRDLELFWTSVWQFCGVVTGARADGAVCERVLIGRSRVAPPDPALGPRWFLGARLNFAENLLRYDDD